MQSTSNRAGQPAVLWNWQRSGDTVESAVRGGAAGDVRQPLLPLLRSDDAASEARQLDAEAESQSDHPPASSEGSQCRARCTLPSTIATLTIGVLGTGQLALPFALSRVGLYFGVACLGTMGFFAVCTLYMLSACKLTAADYGNLLRMYLGPTFSHSANLLLALYAWGGGVTYLMILGKELVAVLDHVAGHLSYKQSTDAFLCAAVLLVVLPLSCVRQLDRLKFTSTFGACAAVYITVVVTINSFQGVWSEDALEPCHGKSQPQCEGDSCSRDAGSDKLSTGFNMFPVLVPPAGQHSNDTAAHFSLIPDFQGLPMFHILFNITTTLAICGFALNSAWCFVPLVHSLRDPTSRRTSALIVGSQSIVLINYAVISVAGYFAYCSDTKDDILQNLPNTPAVLIARGMLVVQLACALPLRFSITRGIVTKYTFGEAPLEEDFHPERQTWLHVAMTMAIVGSATLVAVKSSSIALVMSLASTVCASAISYVFPAASYLLLLSSPSQDKPPTPRFVYLHYAVASLILCYGLLMMLGGTAINLIGASKGYVVIGG